MDLHTCNTGEKTDPIWKDSLHIVLYNHAKQKKIIFWGFQGIKIGPT